MPNDQKGKGTIVINNYKGYTRNLIKIACTKGPATQDCSTSSLSSSKQRANSHWMLPQDGEIKSQQPLPVNTTAQEKPYLYFVFVLTLIPVVRTPSAVLGAANGTFLYEI